MLASTSSFAAKARRAAPATGDPRGVEGVSFGDYVIEAEIAHGGMGVVYRARQVSLDRIVALKVMMLGRHSSADSVQRFRREGQAAAALRHHHIVAIHEVGVWEGQHYLSMEFVEGRNLAELLRDGPLAPRRAAELARDIAAAVHYAHGQGVLHRDLKPSNVLVDAFGQVRLTDFGLAKRMDDGRDLTMTGQVVGTPNYLSPEAAAGRHAEVGPASDTYALGALLYELLTGRPPFLAGSLGETLQRIRDSDPVPPRALNRGVPRDLETICLKCLEKDPLNRYPMAGGVEEDLDRWLRGETIRARPATGVEQAVKWMRRNPWITALLTVAALATLAVVTTLSVANVRIRAANARTADEAEESRRRLVRLNVHTGNGFVGSGEALSALAWYVEALALERGDPVAEEVHRRRIGAVLRRGPELEQLWFHEAYVSDARFSPDGRRVAAVSHLGSLLLWDADTGQPVGSPIRADLIRMSPDSRRFLSWKTGEWTRFWRLSDGSADPVLTNLPPRTGAAFSVDGGFLACFTDHWMWFVDAESGRVTEDLPESEPLLGNARFSADGRWLVGYDRDQTMIVWDMERRRERPRLFRLDESVNLWELRPDGGRMAAGLANNSVRQWELPSGRRHGPDLVHRGVLQSIQYSPDGRRLVTAEWDGHAYLWDAETGEPIGIPMVHESGVRWARFSPDGRQVATAGWDMTVRFWDAETMAPRLSVLRHGGFVTSLSYSTEGDRVLTGCQDSSIRIWRLGNRPPARLTLHHGGTVFRTRYDRAGARLVTAGQDGTARIWNRETGELQRTLHHQSPVWDACFSPDGRWVLTGGEDGMAGLWKADTGVLAFPKVAHGGRVKFVDFTPDGRHFLTAGDAQSQVHLWDADTGQAEGAAIDHGALLGQARFSPDGTHLLTGGADGLVQVWDRVTHQPIGPRLKVGGLVSTAAFSPDGRRVAASWTDESQLPSVARVWNVADGTESIRPLMHMDGILGVSFSRDGRRILTSGEDNSARIWDAATGEPLTPALRHRSFVRTAAFSPDGRLVATASEDGTARVWEAETGEPVTPVLDPAGRADWVEWSPDGREIATGGSEMGGRVFDVSPAAGTVERLRLQAELLGSQRIRSASGAAALTRDELVERWTAWRAR